MAFQGRPVQILPAAVAVGRLVLQIRQDWVLAYAHGHGDAVLLVVGASVRQDAVLVRGGVLGLAGRGLQAAAAVRGRTALESCSAAVRSWNHGMLFRHSCMLQLRHAVHGSVCSWLLHSERALHLRAHGMPFRPDQAVVLLYAPLRDGPPGCGSP